MGIYKRLVNKINVHQSSDFQVEYHNHSEEF